MIKIEIKSFLPRMTLSVLLIFLAVFVIGNSIKGLVVKNQIWIEAEDAKSVLEPLRKIEIKGASNGQGIISNGNHFVREGFAKYTFDVETEGEYIVWGRCYWPTVCNNSFQVAIDNNPLQVLGEDPSVGQWHWIKGPTAKLSKGRHELILWNREEYSQIDKFLITTDPSFVPFGAGTSNAISEDFEEKSTLKSFSFSNQKIWRVVKDVRTDNASLALMKKDNQNVDNEKALIKITSLTKYFFNLAYKVMDVNSNVLVYLNYKDDLNYCAIEFYGNKIIFLKSESGRKIILKQITQEANRTDVFNNVSISKDDAHYQVKVNGKMTFDLDVPSLLGEFVGFGSSSNKVYFDNVSINSEQEINYMENFHGTDFKTVKDRPEISKEYFKNLKLGRRNWWSLQGDWNVRYGDGFEVIEGKVSKEKIGTIVFGEDFWNNYTIQFAAKASGNGGIGIIFNFQDDLNYSLFKWEQEGEVWKQSIVKIINGSENLKHQKLGPPIKSGLAYWYNIKLKLRDDSLRVILDNKIVLNLVDNDVKGTGKVGLWTNSNDGVSFDDIKVFSTNKMDEAKDPSKFEYDLMTRQLAIATSFGDWIPSADGVVRLRDSISNQTACINKVLFERSLIFNKRSFWGAFEVNSNTTDIPKDISANYQFYMYTNSGKDTYNFYISENEIKVEKNSKSIFLKSLSLSKRNKVKILRSKNIWEVRVMDQLRLKLRDDTPVDSMQLAVGYSGIGEGKVIIKNISVENIKK